MGNGGSAGAGCGQGSGLDAGRGQGWMRAGVGAGCGQGSGLDAGRGQGRGTPLPRLQKALQCPVFPIWAWAAVGCTMEPAVPALLGWDLSCGRAPLVSPGPDPFPRSSRRSRPFAQNFTNERMGRGFPGAGSSHPPSLPGGSWGLPAPSSTILYPSPVSSHPPPARPQGGQGRKVWLVRLRPSLGGVRRSRGAGSPLARLPQPRARHAGRARALLKQIPWLRVRSAGVWLVKGRGNRGLSWQRRQPPLLPAPSAPGGRGSGTRRWHPGGAGGGTAERSPPLPAPAAGPEAPARCLRLALIAAEQREKSLLGSSAEAFGGFASALWSSAALWVCAGAFFHPESPDLP